MTGTIHTALNNLLQTELTLNPKHISRASVSHNYIRNLLENKNDEDNLFPRLIDGDFLSGSYRRRTKIHPLDDVDVMMVMDGSGLIVVENGIPVNVEVRGSGDTDNPLLQHMGVNSLLSSRTVRDLFEKTLRKSHPKSKVADDGPAVNVWLDSNNMGIDVVPCFHIIPKDESQDYYYIPEGGTSEKWIKTNPKIDEMISDRLHAKHNELFKGLVRLAKYWNKIFNGDAIKSYHLETLLWHLFDTQEDPLSSYEYALAYFFSKSQTLLSSNCPDKTGLGGPIDAYLSSEKRQKSISKVNQTLQILKIAYEHPHTTDEMKLKAWKNIFGEKFIY